jgi:hypothetical protein
MNRVAFVSLCLGLALPGTAAAQQVTAVEGVGYPVGEGTVIHPTVGGELGFTDNVFYGDSDSDETGRFAAGIFRLVAEAAIASKEITPEEPVDPLLDETAEEPAEPAHQKISFRAGGRLAYSEYISGNEAVRSQRNLAADLNGNIVIAPQGTVAFSADERFVRDTRPTNFESFGDTNRIFNTLALGLKYQPGGRQINGGLRWENHIDFFENSSHRVANRMENYLHLRSEWNFFPYSKVFADASYGFIGGFGSTSSATGMPFKRSANPIRGGIGIATAITEIFTVKAHLGWAYASYSGGASYNSPLLGTEIGYRYSPVGRIVLGYSWDHFDSINADYFVDHALTARVDHQFGKIVADVYGDVRFRSYAGVPMELGGGTDRADLVFAVGADASYVLKDWLAIVASYRTEGDATDYETTVDIRDNPSYVRTEITAGVRAAL